MSIGKSSIARAVNATATKTQSANVESVVTMLSLEKIGELSIVKKFDDITDLKQSVAKRGILCPVLVALTSKGDLWLIDGYRRVAAAKELSLTQIAASVINVETKSEANRIYTELSKLKPVAAADDIHQEKFRVLCVKDHDLPSYLL